jgi:hypothetical protein
MSDAGMRNRLDSFSGTVQEVIDWTLQRGLDPTAVAITACHLKWQSPETPQEAERRAEFQAAQDRRHEEWERVTWERLKAKFDV